MEASWRCAQALALLPIYMVAGSYWCPTLLAGGLQVDLRAPGLSIAVAVTDTTKPAARWVSAVPRGVATRYRSLVGALIFPARRTAATASLR